MKKLLNVLLVRRPEIENKWWHRLANVLIFASTVVFLLFLSAIVFSDFEFRTALNINDLNPNDYRVVSEDKSLKQYPVGSTISADEFCGKYGCVFTTDQFKDLPPPPKGQQGFTLEQILINQAKARGASDDEIVQDILKRNPGKASVFQQARNKGANSTDILNEIIKQNTSSSASDLQLTEPQRQQLDGIVHQMTLNGEPDSAIQLAVNNFKEMSSLAAKYGATFTPTSLPTRAPLFLILLKNLAIVFFMTLGWFIFWESIVYRTLLYIIYGKRK